MDSSISIQSSVCQLVILIQEERTFSKADRDTTLTLLLKGSKGPLAYLIRLYSNSLSGISSGISSRSQSTEHTRKISSPFYITYCFNVPLNKLYSTRLKVNLEKKCHDCCELPLIINICILLNLKQRLFLSLHSLSEVVLKNVFFYSTFQFFEPWSIHLRVGILLLYAPAHLFVGEPVELLAHQAAVIHLQDKQKETGPGGSALYYRSFDQTSTYCFAKGAPLFCSLLATCSTVMSIGERHQTCYSLGQH